MKKNKSARIFFTSLIILFIMFVVLMIILESGYYESKKRESVVLTDKMIKEYEEKIRNNEPIDLDSYIKEDKKYYGNKVSEMGVTISYKLEMLMNYSIKAIDNVMKTLF